MHNLDQFRQEVREWLEENCPPSMRTPMVPEEEVWGGRNAKYVNPESKLWLDRMGEKGWTAPNIPKEYGGGGLDRDQAKVLHQELHRIKARQPLNSFGIWMLAPCIIEFGSEEQKLEHIPKIIKGEIRWCQGYSEPGSGSDLASLSTKAEDMGDHYLVNGQKVWTSYADKADWIFALVRTGPKEPKHNGISFLLIDMATEGVSTKPITLISGKSPFCETFFDNVKVPKENLLPNKSGLGAPLGCLDSARYGIAWGAIGAAMDCYDSALRYSKERIQFDRPIASYQLVQKKLAEMLTEITKAQLLVWRLGQLKNEGKATTQQISMAKRNNVDMALKIAREARQIHGGMGITGEYPIMRHMMNLESVITYEGTHDIHLLITGMDITGISAFRVD